MNRQVFCCACLHMLQCIIFTCLICWFLWSTSTVEDEYSRARLTGSLVPSAAWLLSFSLSCREEQGQRKGQGESHDMRYSCFRPWWYEILLLWCDLFCRGILGEEENWVFREVLLGVYSRRWGRVGHSCRSALPWGRMSTYIGISQ